MPCQVLYQKKQKINARKKAHKLKIQLNESFTELVVVKKDVESIEKRVNALDKKYPGLAKHFQDFFRVDKICDCSICMDDINSTDKYHTCSNSTCGLIFRVDCLKNTAKQMQGEMTECQFCKVEDPVYPTILDEMDDNLDDSQYESDGDEDFIPGIQENPITQRDIDRFQSNMFLTPEELEAQLEEEEEDRELDPDYNPDDDDEDDEDDEDDDDDDDEDDDEDDEDDDEDDEDDDR